MSLCPCAPIHGCYFCLLCPIFPVSKEDWDTQLDRLNHGSGWLLAIPPGYHQFLVTTYHLKLSSLAYCACIQGLLLIIAWHQGERMVLGHPAAVHMLCPDIFSDCLLLPVSASCKLRASSVYLAHALIFSHPALLLKALLLL